MITRAARHRNPIADHAFGQRYAVLDHHVVPEDASAELGGRGNLTARAPGDVAAKRDTGLDICIGRTDVDKRRPCPEPLDAAGPGPGELVVHPANGRRRLAVLQQGKRLASDDLHANEMHPLPSVSGASIPPVRGQRDTSVSLGMGVGDHSQCRKCFRAAVCRDEGAHIDVCERIAVHHNQLIRRREGEGTAWTACGTQNGVLPRVADLHAELCTDADGPCDRLRKVVQVQNRLANSAGGELLQDPLDEGFAGNRQRRFRS
jgi:hypothetical protein